MATKTSGSPPDKRRKYDEAFKAEALRCSTAGNRPNSWPKWAAKQ